MELMIVLDSQSGIPLYEQIYRYIKEEILRGNLHPGRKVPSSRELAKSLKVSRSTAKEALEQLASEGYLEPIARSGYFVASLDGIYDGKNGGKAVRMQELRKKEEIDFSPLGIDLENFPYSTWRKVSRSVLKEEEKSLFLKGDPRGDLPFREEIRDYLHRARGVVCTAEQIVVGAGSEYLLMLLSLLLGKGTVIAMENPAYRQTFRVLSGMGHPIIPVEMDGSGICIERLKKAVCQAGPPSAVYTAPSHQFPIGIVMPVKRRQELLSWAGETEGRYIIEDDYDSEFRYRGKPIPALQGMDGAGRVIYMGTFSKSLAPAIRIGYMVLPLTLLKRYESEAGFYSSTVSRVDQQILSRFMAGGYFERHLNRMRTVYKKKHDALLGALKPLTREFSLSGEYAGLHVLLTGKGTRTEAELIRTASDAGVRVYGLSDFYIGGEPGKETQTVILGYANLCVEEITKGISILAEVWSDKKG